MAAQPPRCCSPRPTARSSNTTSIRSRSRILALAAINKLDTADGSFAVAEIDQNVVFLDHGAELARRRIPRDDDAEGWAEITSPR